MDILRSTLLSSCSFCRGPSGVLFYELGCRVCMACRALHIVTDSDVERSHGLTSSQLCALNCLVANDKLRLTCMQCSASGAMREYTVVTHFYRTSDVELHVDLARTLAADMGWGPEDCGCGGCARGSVGRSID